MVDKKEKEKEKETKEKVCNHDFRQKMKVQRQMLGYTNHLVLDCCGYYCTKCLLEIHDKEELE